MYDNRRYEYPLSPASVIDLWQEWKSKNYRAMDWFYFQARELAAVLERSKGRVSVDLLPAHFKGVESVSALGISAEGRKIKRGINFERGILTAKTDVLDRPFHKH